MFGEEIRDVRDTARQLLTRYPDAALALANALVADNEEQGNTKRAKIWAQVVYEIESQRLRPTRN